MDTAQLHANTMPHHNDFVMGLLVPINGGAGIWGPSSIACAQLAQAEINAGGGLGGRQVELKVIDASDEAAQVGRITAEFLRAGAIDAIVGMHTSFVRQRVLREVAGRIPYVYTPLYEGGETTPGVYALGETPEQQLRPAIEYLAQRYHVKRWMFIGNDYVWPRTSHAWASTYVQRQRGEVLADHYVPFGMDDFGDLLEQIRYVRPDALLLSLVGQDAIAFNRQFGKSGLSQHVLRLSTAIEENGLLAMGEDNTDGLFVSSGYFAALRSDANMSFKERYYTRFGDRAPTLNALGQSTYEGVHFMAELARQAARDELPLPLTLKQPLHFKSVRGIRYHSNASCEHPTFLAQAQGHFFRVLDPQ
jgi:urea transport system substrate-binding protein